MTIDSLIASTLYADDLVTARRFYEQVLGLRPLGGSAPGRITFRLTNGHVLHICDPSKPQRNQPTHGAHGRGHVTLGIAEDSYADWADRLRRHGVQVVDEIVWDGCDVARPGTSLFIRDPAGNLIELITGDIWPD